MPRPPFDALRAAFLLVAMVVLAEMLMVLFGIGGCMWLILSGRNELGACQVPAQQAREVFAELLTAVLALLLAARGPPSKPPEDDP
jgi:hypothetical protein